MNDRAEQAGGGAVCDPRGLPFILLPSEAAALLRTTIKGIYHRWARGQLPGGFKDGDRLRIYRDLLLESLRESCAPSRTSQGRKR